MMYLCLIWCSDGRHDELKQHLAKVEKMGNESYDLERELNDPDDYDGEDEVPRGESIFD